MEQVEFDGRVYQRDDPDACHEEGPFRVFYVSYGWRSFRDFDHLSSARGFCEYLLEPSEDSIVGPGSPDAIIDTRDGSEHDIWE